MTRIIINLITFLQVFNLFSQCPYQYKTIKERVTILKNYVHKKNKVTEQEFFDAFPCTFKEMQEFFGYDDIKGASPLYDDYSVGELILDTFQNLSNISQEKYYKKYINICIDGKFQADHIYEGFGIASKMDKDTKGIIPILAKYTDTEIRSVFRFVFDGREPMIWTDYYQKLYNKINKIDSRVAKLMKESFNKLFEEDKHSH